MKYIHVKSLEKYHPGYKDRELSWCKIYFKMLNCDPDFELLDEIDKWRFIALIMIELQGKGPTPLNEKYLDKKGFDLKKRPMLLTLDMLQKFVEVVTEDSKPCYLDKEEDIRYKIKNKIKSGVTFVPPSMDEACSFFLIDLKASKEQAQKFHDFYASKNWFVGKNRMVDWQAAARGSLRWEAPATKPVSEKAKNLLDDSRFK